jgi:hypothetical protein
MASFTEGLSHDRPNHIVTASESLRENQFYVPAGASDVFGAVVAGQTLFLQGLERFTLGPRVGQLAEGIQRGEIFRGVEEVAVAKKEDSGGGPANFTNMTIWTDSDLVANKTVGNETP